MTADDEQTVGRRRSALAMARSLGRPPTVVIGLLVVDLLIGAMYLAGRNIDAFEAIGPVWKLNAERSLPTWYSAVQLAFVGALLLAYAAMRARRPASIAVFWLAGAGVLFLSLDEHVEFHERFARYAETVAEGGLERSGPWMLVVAPLFLTAIAVAAYLARHDFRDRRAIALLFAFAALLFTFCFAGLEAARNFVASTSALDDLMTLVEEIGEMVAATLALWAALALLRSHGVAVLASREGAG